MHSDHRTLQRIVPFCLALALAAVLPARAELRDTGRGLLVDSDQQLTWVADANFVVDSGLADRIVLPRARALAVLAQLNAGVVENFGHDDWRLPTARELARLLSVDGDRLAALTGTDAEGFLAGVESAAAAGAIADPVVVWPVHGSAILAGFSNVVLFATNSMWLKHHDGVVSGDVVVNDSSPGPTFDPGFELHVEHHVSAPAGNAVKADSVDLDHDAVVGSLYYNDLDNDRGTILGSEVTPLALPVFAQLPEFFAQTPAPGSPDVAVPHHGSATLPAGDYGAITLDHDSTLVFTGGVYNVQSIAADHHVQLLFEGPSSLRVAGRFAVDHHDFVGPEEGSGTAVHDLAIYVAGTNGGAGGLNSTPFAASVAHDTEFDASLYVPNGTLSFDHQVEATGAFLARDLVADNHTDFTLDSYFFNRPPVAADDAATVDEGGTVSVLDSGETSLLANDTDPDGDDLTVSAAPVSGPSHGSVTLNPDGTFSYTHDGSETTSDSFVYQVCDSSFPTLCDTATVSITVNPVDDPPVAVDDAATVTEDDPATAIDVLGNDTDVDGGPIAIDSATQPAHGAVAITGGGTGLTYQPAPDYCNTPPGTSPDTFTYTLAPGGSTATVSVAVTCVNDPPNAVDDSATVIRGGTVTVLDSGSTSVLTNDTDIDSTLLTVTTTPLDGPFHGSLTLNADGTFSYTNDGLVNTVDSFVYQVCDDGVPVGCSSATVIIRVRTPLTVTVDKSGLGSGSVVSNPAGIDCGPTCSAVFDGLDPIVLVATPDDGSTFGGWTGDPDCEDGILTSLGDKFCHARFDLVTASATLTVDFAGAGSGHVTSDPAGIDCTADCSADYPIPTRVTLTPTADEGSAFAGWSGDADCSDGDVALSGDTTCVATFEPQQPTITVIKFGLGSGTVTSDPAGIDCGPTCSAPFDPTPDVTLTATPDVGSTFGGWSGDPDCSDGVVTPVGDITCYARFDTEAEPAVLTVTLAGTGSGSVTSDPAGIDCPSGACTAAYPIPTRVDLTAVADAGSVFTGWSGDVDCDDGEVALSGDTTCTATFDVLPTTHTLTVTFIGGGTGQVRISPDPLICDGSEPCVHTFADGATATLSARPDSEFGGWGGDCTGGDFTTSVVMDADKTCTATFLP